MNQPPPRRRLGPGGLEDYEAPSPGGPRRVAARTPQLILPNEYSETPEQRTERREAERRETPDIVGLLADAPALTPEEWAEGGQLLNDLAAGQAKYTKQSAAQLHRLAIEGFRLYILLSTAGQDVLGRLQDSIDQLETTLDLMRRLDVLPALEPEPETDEDLEE